MATVDIPVTELKARASQAKRPTIDRIDSAVLAADLKAHIEGEVRFDDGSRALYSTDGSNYRQVPIGVVIPSSIEDVVQTVAIARRHGAPVLPRGGGTSLAGQCCNVAVVMDFSKYLNRLLSIDPQAKRASVQPGLILDELRDAAERYHLTFGPDPATHNHNTLGGMLGNNSCGIHSVMAGRTEDNVHELDILTYDGFRTRVGPTSPEELDRIIRDGGRRGEIYGKLKALVDRYAPLIRSRYPKIPRRVSGYSLPPLLPENGFHVARALVGSEGTCVTILEAEVALVTSPPCRVLLVLGYPDVYTAGDHIPEVMSYGPVGCEGLDDRLIQGMDKKGLHVQDAKLLPEGNGWLLVEFGGETREEAEQRAHKLMDALKRKGNAPSMKLFSDRKEEKKVWEIRESGLGATARVPGEPDTWPGWEDSAVPPDKVGAYLRDLRRLFDKYGYMCALYGHFGQGCIHTRIDFGLRTEQGIKQYLAFIDEASDLVLNYGGSFSGEHGDGQARGELLPKMFGEELMQAMREFKAIWDPQWKMNPGKVIEPYRINEHLRLGTDYNPPQLKTHFKFPDDHGSFSRAALRCVGVGKCRRLDVGTMCPSFMITREEKDSTRGRARLLFEMLQGGVLKHGWREDAVHEALDLCLSCKGCKGDCPVNVDMATYKAEFLSHYYACRLRPIYHYTLGQIHWWSRLAAWAPGVVNFYTQTPGIRDVLKRLAGVALERELPAYAEKTFKQQFFARAPASRGKSEVMLWPDTFNNHFHPETAMAGVEVLEAAGYRVSVPRPWLCCGRPLYEYGMLRQAKWLLKRVLAALRPQIRAGVPLVGLEPSCLTTFRDELVSLFPHDEDARCLSRQSFMLSEFLEQKQPDYAPPRLPRKAVVHSHCYHKSVLGMEAEEKLLAKLGLDYRVLDSGCCGAAGAFGFEPEHYDISIKCGERVLLPAVREAAEDSLIIADGFICREQIRQNSRRQALHVAQVMRMAMHQAARPQAHLESCPERAYVPQKRPQASAAAALSATALGVGAAVGAGVLLWKLVKGAL